MILISKAHRFQLSAFCLEIFELFHNRKNSFSVMKSRHIWILVLNLKLFWSRLSVSVGTWELNFIHEPLIWYKWCAQIFHMYRRHKFRVLVPHVFNDAFIISRVVVNGIETLGGTGEELSVSRSPEQDLNPEYLEYKLGVLLIQLRH